MTNFKFGVIGHYISYSKSPIIFNAIFKLRKIDGEFIVYDFPEKEFENYLPKLRKLDGFSVTIPYKEKIIDSLDVFGDSIGLIRAVNSVKVHKSKLAGFNTDGHGFLYGLKELSSDVSIENVLVIGLGGAARAVIHALIRQSKVKSLTICGRKNIDIGELKEKYFNYVTSDVDFIYSEISQINRGAEYDLIVNCTPCGDVNNQGESPIPEDFEFSGCGIYYDLIYNPAKTMLMKKAEKSGWQTINGYRMLIRQAVESYKIWSGDDISADKLTKDILNSEEQ